MKNKKSKIITLGVLVIAVIFTVIFAVGATDSNTTEYWKLVPMDIETYRKDTGFTAPDYDDTDDWLFAGWFDEEGKAVSKDIKSGTYYAKFVPADILGLKAQVNIELSNNDTTDDDTKTYTIDGKQVEKGAGAIRFVTSVDTLDYSKIGFKITRGTGAEEDRANNKVYQQLYATGEATDGSTKTDEFKPKDLFNADASTYFKTWTYTKVPSSAYNMDITVTPYWVTLDGTTVEGTTSIKCVNMGRQWKYIFVDDTGSDDTGTGTRGCPYATLNGALAHIKEYGQSTGGEVWVLNSVTAASGATWNEHGLDVTIKGDTLEDGTTETVDFSANAHYKLGDSATFENMTLKLSSSNFYANGHRFEVASGVTSDNSGTTIIGGGNGTKVTGDTSVTLLAGSYKAVYGGGLNADVDGNTYVTLKNVDIYDTAKNNNRYVCGGGRNGNVTRNTYVTVGEGFNSAHDWENDSYLSAVFGGGYGSDGSIAAVGGDTYVVFEGGAKTNYVHGAGTSYSEVKGTSHVTIDGGYAMSVYGGASSKETVNASTSVVMKSGTVEQIFGGSNKKNMTGNTDVRILGGTIKRRVYAGCYNDYELFSWQSTSEVDGYASLTFGPDTYATLAKSHSGGDCSYLASSRYSNTEKEIGVFIVNDYDVPTNATNVGLVGHSSSFSNLIKAYNYRVNATEGGAVYSVGDSIQVIPDKNKVATVRKGSETGEVVFYTESEGICVLPELTTDPLELYVVFTSDTPSDVNTDNYEAKTNGAYYSTLEEAVSAANVLSQTSDSTDEIVVSILTNTVEVASALNIAEGANITIACEENVTASVNREDEFALDNRMVNVEQGAILTLKDVILDGRNSSDIENSVTELSAITESSKSLVNVSGTLIIDDATIQYAKKNGEGAAIYIQDKGAVTMNNGAISNNYATSGSGGAVSVYLGTFTMEDGTISGNMASASGGAFIVRNGSTLTINKGTISENKALTASNNGGGAIFQHANTTVDINGGTISGNESSYRGGAIYMHGSANSQLTIKDAMISENSSNQEGGAVYICADSVATLEDGVTISGNEATLGGAICVAGTLDMKGSSISNNTATGNGSGVYVIGTEEKAATFNMSGGSICGHGTKAEPKTVAGNAVYVAANSSFIMSGLADISSNYSTKQGNGVCVIADGSFTMNGGTIQNNHTTDTGSGVATYGSFTMTAGTIKDNTAGKSAGGVIIRDTGSFSMTGGTIDNNTATDDGGGIYIQSDNATTMKGGTVQNNNAKRGGGIFINSGSTFTMSSDSVITANEATTNGAGVHVAKGTFAMSGGSITNHGTAENPSTVEGAGVYVAAGKFNMSGGAISNNHSTANGAGVAAYATFNMSGTSTIHDNITTSDGGGVFVAKGVTYTMNNVAEQTIYGNQANNGGGVAIVGTFNFKKGVITNNTATENGGGTYIDGGTFTMTDTASTARTISANTAKAGAGVYVNDGAFTMSEGTIESNLLPTTGSVYGAGVYLKAGTFDLSGGSIRNHGVGSATEVTTRGAYEGAGICAAGTSVVNMSGGTVSNNYVSGSGAGVAIRDTAKFIMHGGTISDNTAEGAGGAMIVRSTRKETVEEQENLVAAFVMNGGTISGNSALRDDANGGGAIFQSKNTRIEIHDGTISGNRSSYNGGAIFANAGTDDDNALFLITGGSITQNTAANYGAGVYVNSGICNMTGGTISEHGDADTSTSGAINGAGVYVASGGTFNMSGDATITNNYTSGNGAGVYVAGAFNMTGGTISSNKSAKDGAGVYLVENIGMEIDGGTIISNTTSGNGGAIAGVGNNEIQLTSGEISGNTGKTVQGIFLTMVTNGTQVIMDVGFNMGTNDIRFNNVSNTEPILKFVGGTTLSHYTTDNKLQIGLHNGSRTGSALFECESNEAATNIIELLNSNNTSSSNNNNKWSFSVDGLNIKVAK